MAKRLTIDVEAFVDEAARLHVRVHSEDEFKLQLRRRLTQDRRGGVSFDQAARQATRDRCLAMLWQVVAGDAIRKSDAVRRTIAAIDDYRNSGEFDRDLRDVHPREVGLVRALMGAIILTEMRYGLKTVDNAITPTWVKKRKTKRHFGILFC